MNALRSSSLSPFSGFSRFSSIPGRRRAPLAAAFAVRPVPTDVSPSILSSSSSENVICSTVELRRLAREQLHARARRASVTHRIARSHLDGSM